MGHDIKTALRPALSFLILLTIVTGLIYPLAITGVAQLLFPSQANGSLIKDHGRILGSELIGQNFVSPLYFHPRPSAAGTNGYDASASSGSNLGPTSQALADSIRQRVAAVRADGVAGPVPADAVTASGSGLDPHISPEYALAQVQRVAAARRLDATAIRDLVNRNVEQPSLGLLGTPHVNVLLLNRQLDALGAHRGP